MNQVKIGKFISECRKNKNLTQMQLAEKLNITDRAVSKWENGKGMPDSSIMLDLCNILGISVNELLSGEVINMEEYNKNVEKNIIGLKKEVEKKKKTVKILKIILIIFLIIIIIIAIKFVNIYRKYLIISDLQNKFTETVSNEEFYEKITWTYGYDDSYSSLTCYRKNENELQIWSFSNGFESYSYYNGKKLSTYSFDPFYDELANDNVVSISESEKNDEYFKLYNGLESSSKLETFINCISVNITTDEYDGKECYVIKNYEGENTIGDMYIEKDTGLLLFATQETIYDDGTSEIVSTDNAIYEYEFDNVNDEIFEEPDISEYTIIEEE